MSRSAPSMARRSPKSKSKSCGHEDQIVPADRAGHVVAVAPLTANLIEVSIGGLDGHPTIGGDEFNLVMVPPPASRLPDGHTFADYMAQDGQGPVRAAYYSTRRGRSDVGEIDIWVVLHRHDGSGVGSWLARAHVGSAVALWGPRRIFTPLVDTRSLLLVADETGFGAVASIIERAGSDVSIMAVLETIDDDHHPPLPDHERLDVRWVHRGDDPPGRVNRLLPAVIESTATKRPCQVFGAAESRQITEVRRFARTQLQLTASHVSATGYWRLDG